MQAAKSCEPLTDAQIVCASVESAIHWHSPRCHIVYLLRARTVPELHLLIRRRLISHVPAVGSVALKGWKSL